MKILQGSADVVPIDAVKPHPMNARQGNVGEIFESIEANGFYGRLIIQKSTDFILAGNHRWRAAVAAGATEIPVEYVDVDDALALRILEADNATADDAGYSLEQKAQNLQALLEHYGTLTGSGSNEDDLNDLLAKIQPYQESDVQESRLATVLVKLVAKWEVQPSQLWRIPSRSIPGAYHRVLCEDIRQGTIAIDRLMDGARAQLVHTDPPYGVDHEHDTARHSFQPSHEVQNDGLAPGELVELLSTAFSMCVRAARETAGFYIWHASQTRRTFEQAMAAAGLEERQYLIWAKERILFTAKDYHQQHEPCFYAQRIGSRAWFTEDRTQSTVWRITPRGRGPEDIPVMVSNDNGVIVSLSDGNDIYIGPLVPKGKKFRAIEIPEGASLLIVSAETQADLWEIRRDDQSDYLHPTQKPAALAARAIMNSSTPGDAVLDVFAGSGSTLVAAEQLGRVGYGMDKAPAAVAAVLESLQILGLEPELTDE